MNKKKLDETSVLNELKNSSLFFRREPKVVPEPEQTPTSLPSTEPEPPAKVSPANLTADGIVVSRYHDTTRDTTIPRHQDSIYETTRRAVKQFGKEAATHRFTLEEKKALKAIERDYGEQGIRTSENEITRIAINYMLEDYRVNKKKSIVAQVLELLNS